MWGKNEKGREESKGMRQREIKEREAMKYVGEGWKGRESKLREQKEKVKCGGRMKKAGRRVRV